MSFTTLLNDQNISSSFVESHAKIDNYQIYSFAVIEQVFTVTGKSYRPGTYRAENYVYDSYLGAQGSFLYATYNAIPVIELEPIIETLSARYTIGDTPIGAGGIYSTNKVIAWQSYSPLGKITTDIAALIKSYPPRARNNISYSVNRYINDVSNPNVPVEISLPRIPQTYIQGIIDPEIPDFGSLLNGYYSPLIKPENLRIMATSTKTFKYSYYRQNKLETHPNVAATLDWFTDEIKTIKGQFYLLPIIDPVLGTLLIPNTTAKTEILSWTNSDCYLPKFLFKENLSELFSYWETLTPTITPPVLKPFANLYWRRAFRTSTFRYMERDFIDTVQYNSVYVTANLIPGVYLDEKIYLSIEYIYGAVTVRIRAANNDIWKFGNITSSENSPPDNHPIFDINEYQLFEAPKTDESTDESLGFGSLTMDSPRILEIHAALDAAKYAVNELDPDVPRVTTLGYWIEKTGNLLGHRPNALGEINHDLEKAKYARQRLTNPQWGKSQYSLNQFGKRGLVIPHLPNTYTKSGKLQKLYDVVYDIPQLIQALHDQVDIAQGVQHASQIRVKLADGSVQGFPDLLALQIETLKIASSMRDSVTRNQISSLVTGAEVRELFGAIGTPVAQKYLTFKDSVAKKSLQVPYFGHQQGKESVMGGISTLKINQAIALGVLMPKIQPTKTKLNPFNVLKKKA